MKSPACTWLALLALPAAVCACSQQIPPPLPATFERPLATAFVCMQTKPGTSKPTLPVALDQCRPVVVNGSTVDDPTHALFALVTQSSQGEVASVNLKRMQVIDTRNDIPGYTFVPVGELPGPIAVPSEHPEVTYVANRGSRDISVVRTASFAQVSPSEDATLQRVRVAPDSDAAASAPTAVVLSPDEDALFVSSAEGGLLLRMPIIRCDRAQPDCRDGEIDTDHIVRVPIEDSFAKASVPSGSNEAQPEPYMCGAAPPLPARPPPHVGLPMSPPGPPQPTGLAVDAFCDSTEAGCVRRLLVGDREQPIVHAVDIDALANGNPADAILQPIATGTPTQSVVVTPRVPVSLDAAAGATQYVYAIDATDGSVLVTQDGRVLSVNDDPNGRADRLNLGHGATSGAPIAISLAMLTPHFDVNGPPEQWLEANADPSTGSVDTCTDPQHTTRDPGWLRGVFLAVGLTDGTVHIFDVHDRGLKNCRDCEGDPFPVRRNNARISIVYQATNPPLQVPYAPIVTPEFIVDNDAVPVNSNGTTNDPRVSGLACVTCPKYQVPTFPDALVGADTNTTNTTETNGTASSCGANQGRVCSLADPWVDPLQSPLSWIAYYEGPIPGTRGGQGQFIEASSPDNLSGGLEFAAETDFCAAGVLGDQDQSSGHPGDQLIITSELPPAPSGNLSTEQKQLRADCEALVKARDEDGTPIAFRIERAYADRLAIASKLVGAVPNITNHTLDYTFVHACFGEAFATYEVHTRKTYTVFSPGVFGFRNRVVEDPNTKRCKIDEGLDPHLTSRAYPGSRFDNGYVSFNALTPQADVPVRLNIVSATRVPKLVLDASVVSSGVVRGVLPVDLSYSDVLQKLYIVDASLRGLIEVPLDPMPAGVSISYQ